MVGMAEQLVHARPHSLHFLLVGDGHFAIADGALLCAYGEDIYFQIFNRIGSFDIGVYLLARVNIPKSVWFGPRVCMQCNTTINAGPYTRCDHNKLRSVIGKNALLLRSGKCSNLIGYNCDWVRTIPIGDIYSWRNSYTF